MERDYGGKMGKNSIMNSLGKCIGNIVLHKLLVRHTNKPESVDYLQKEVEEYTNDVLQKVGEFHWNDFEKDEIANIAFHAFKKKVLYYPDISYEEGEVDVLIDETIKEVFDKD